MTRDEQLAKQREWNRRFKERHPNYWRGYYAKHHRKLLQRKAKGEVHPTCACGNTAVKKISSSEWICQRCIEWDTRHGRREDRPRCIYVTSLELAAARDVARAFDAWLVRRGFTANQFKISYHTI